MSDYCATSGASGAPDCHYESSSSKTLVSGALRVALVGTPNAGKASIYNTLAGLRTKTGDYPGVAVARSLGIYRIGETGLIVKGPPGAYLLNPISPDKQVVRDVLTDASQSVIVPDALVVVVDTTMLRRGLNFVAKALSPELPTCLMVTMIDGLTRRAGRLDVAAFGQALGIPAVRVVGNRGIGIPELREHLTGTPSWRHPLLPVSTEPTEVASWADSILEAVDYRAPQQDRITTTVDKVLLNPVPGSLVFFAIMYIFFQAVFTWATPLRDAAEGGFSALGELVHGWLDRSHPLLVRFLGNGFIGGVGAVLTSVPQVIIMFLIITFLEGVGYMPCAASLMGRVMSRVELGGRVFVVLLSLFVYTIPEVMVTRTLPSAKDRVATMLAVPFMTCSARLPIYVLLTSIMIPADAKIGPLSAHGIVMFALYLLGTVSTMVATWVVERLTDRGGVLLPSYMEMSSYRMPRLRAVLIMVWDAYRDFVKKAGTIITLTTVILWVLLNVLVRSEEQFNTHRFVSAEYAAVSATVEDPTSSAVKGDDGRVITDPEEPGKLLNAQKTSYAMNDSWAVAIGRAVQPVFESPSFGWCINMAILPSSTIRKILVVTPGQIAAAEDPEEPSAHLATMACQKNTLTNETGDQLFNSATIATILMFFVYALQCIATVVTMRREVGTWRWPTITYTHMFVTAWVMAALTRVIIAMFM